MLEIDTRDIDSFLEEKNKVYPQLNDIFAGECIEAKKLIITINWMFI